MLKQTRAERHLPRGVPVSRLPIFADIKLRASLLYFAGCPDPQERASRIRVIGDNQDW
jgi:hypothetical protein